MKYLNNCFLDTAAYKKIPNSNHEVSFMKFDNHRVYNSFAPVLNCAPSLYRVADIETKRITTQTLYIEKTYQECLENELSNMLYTKYSQLASQNTIKNNIPSKLNKFWYKIRKYIYGNNEIILHDDISYKRLWCKIHGICNLIHFTNYTNYTKNDNFIVLSKELFSILKNYMLCEFNGIYNKECIRNNTIKYYGVLQNIEIYVNENLKNNNILIGTKTTNDSGVYIMEQNLEINEKTIIWTGAIDNISDKDKDLFNTINVEFLNNLSRFKKILYRLFKNFIN